MCVGFGSSKTLAKFANHPAKKQPIFNSVCDLSALTKAELLDLMRKIAVSDVWGVGRPIAARLEPMGIDWIYGCSICVLGCLLIFIPFAILTALAKAAPLHLSDPMTQQGTVREVLLQLKWWCQRVPNITVLSEMLVD